MIDHAPVNAAEVLATMERTGVKLIRATERAAVMAPDLERIPMPVLLDVIVEVVSLHQAMLSYVQCYAESRRAAAEVITLAKREN